MPMKGGATSGYREVDRWDRGVGWIAYPEEKMQRASHALVGDDGGVWLVDPVDAPGVDEVFADLGEVVGVVVSLDRHTRDAAAFAARHDAPVSLPTWMSGVAEDLDAPVTRYDGELGDSGFEAFRIRDSSFPRWQEVGLYRRDDRTLVVPEAVGTAAFFCAPRERVGVHPALRPFPPRHALGGFEPERLLVGHGPGVMSDAASALREALDGARRNLPAAYGRALREVLL
ncbi:MAG: hypothetical protein ABEK02_02640 [Haloquadratum sp.]